MTRLETFTDADLVQRIVAGDELAFTALFRRHHGTVYRFALLMSGSATLAEDVTQEVFLVLMGEAHRYDATRASLAAYLCGVARNYVRRCLERERLYVPLLAESDSDTQVTHPRSPVESDPLYNSAHNQMIHVVRRAVLTLPVRYREVVVLCDFQELSYADAAAALDCAVGTVNSRLHRGHDLLLKKLRDAGRLDPAAPKAEWLRCFV